MNRRSFLLSALYGGFVFLASKLPGNKYGAVFKVVYVDPDGSGMDYRGHLGKYVYNGQRCCKNCETLFAAWTPGGDVENGPQFCDHELAPVNAAARVVIADIEAAKTLREKFGNDYYAVAS